MQVWLDMDGWVGLVGAAVVVLVMREAGEADVRGRRRGAEEQLEAASAEPDGARASAQELQPDTSSKRCRVGTREGDRLLGMLGARPSYGEPLSCGGSYQGSVN